MSTRTRFEEEAKGNSEMAYSLIGLDCVKELCDCSLFRCSVFLFSERASLVLPQYMD